MEQTQHFQFPEIRRVEALRPLAWLRRGWADLAANPPASLFYGLCFALMGYLLHAVFHRAYEYTSGLAVGFLLVGPYLATGLYDLSRQRESGTRPRLGPSLLSWRANAGAIGIYVLILTVILLIWARASLVIFALFYTRGMPTVAGFLQQVVSVANVEFLAVYFAVGAVFATLVFALSVVSVPCLLADSGDAVTAAAASVVALSRNVPAMLVWAALIVLLIGAGLASLYLGLVLTGPLVGHATWHAYRDLLGPPVPVA